MIYVSEVTPEDIAKILNLYKNICGGAIEYVHPESVCEALKSGDRMTYREGWRIGSNWDGHSKLRFNVEENGCVIATMYENFDLQNRRDDNPDYKAAKAAAQQFKDAVLAL